MKTRGARRLGVVIVAVALAASVSVVIASPAFAAAEGIIWVDAGTLKSVAAATRAMRLTIKNLDDDSWMRVTDGGNPMAGRRLRALTA